MLSCVRHYLFDICCCKLHYLFMQESKRISGVDTLTMGQPLLTEAWQGGTTFGSTIQTTHAVDQKKAKGKHIRDMVKLVDLEGLKKCFLQ